MKQPTKPAPTKRAPGSVVQIPPQSHRRSNRDPKPTRPGNMAKAFAATLRQKGVTDAALADLRALYIRKWSEAKTIRRAGRRSIQLVGTRDPDQVRAEWLHERAELLVRHNLPVDFPIYERFGLDVSTGRAQPAKR
ncbi:MAG TPA: hypothetical protein VHY79_03780 [Rhizomicrobium sp.]|nr:hypothetical protein [Rhizomicrobium sp.]